MQRLEVDDLAMIASIDRSEPVDVEYAMVDGAITERPVTVSEIPPWDATGTGPHSVTGHIEFCRPVMARGGVLLGVVRDERALGLAVVEARFEPELAWLAWLHVTREYRRRGVARALWAAATDVARSAGAPAMYVSATPTGSAVGFYLRQGCRLADPAHPELLAKEPDDIHLVSEIRIAGRSKRRGAAVAASEAPQGAESAPIRALDVVSRIWPESAKSRDRDGPGPLRASRPPASARTTQDEEGDDGHDLAAEHDAVDVDRRLPAHLVPLDDVHAGRLRHQAEPTA